MISLTATISWPDEIFRMDKELASLRFAGADQNYVVNGLASFTGQTLSVA